MTKEQTNQLVSLINQNKGKEALDKMLGDGLSYDEIDKFYDSINFYPNEETYRYLDNHFAARKNKEALDGFFNKL